MKRSLKKLIILCAAFLSVIFLFYFFKLNEIVALETIKKHQLFLKYFVSQNYFFSALIYVMLFSILIACGLPIIIPFSILSGYLFGLFWGIAFAQISCVCGSLLSFVVLRFFVIHWLRDWYGARAQKFQENINKYGYSYLLVLHFLSIIPLFVINLLAALVNVPLYVIAVVTFIGCLPINVLCILAGQQLSLISSYKEIFSPRILIILLLLAFMSLVPLFLKKWRKHEV